MDAKKLREMMGDPKVVDVLSRTMDALKSAELQKDLHVLVQEAAAAGGVLWAAEEAIAAASYSAVLYDISRAPLVLLLDRARNALEQLITSVGTVVHLRDLDAERATCRVRDAGNAIAAITAEIGAPEAAS